MEGTQKNPPETETRRKSRLRAPADNADGRDRMDHNRAASYTRVVPGDALTAGYQAESIRRFADALGMTIVREYEDEECGQCPDDRPQLQRMMDEARSESRPFGAVTPYDRWRFTAGAADPAKYAKELRDAGVELLCMWDKPPRSAQAAQGPAVRRRRAA